MKTSISKFIESRLENIETLVGGTGQCKPKKGNNGFGNGGDDGVPGNSGKTGQDKEDDVVR